MQCHGRGMQGTLLEVLHGCLVTSSLTQRASWKCSSPDGVEEELRGGQKGLSVGEASPNQSSEVEEQVLHFSPQDHHRWGGCFTAVLQNRCRA